MISTSLNRARRNPRDGRQALFPFLLLIIAVLLVIFAGSWGLSVPRDHHENAASAIGDAVEMDGGAFRVDSVTPEHMAPMQMNQFASSGMSMSMPNMDMAPEGYVRFAVELTFVADDRDGLRILPDDVHVSGRGMDPAYPVRHTFDIDLVPKGSAVTGSLIFDAPEDATALQLLVPGSDQPLAVDIEPLHGGHDHGNHSDPDVP